MKTSKAGRELIKEFEGCKLEAYLCPANVWTIGVGHTRGVKKGHTITEAEADDFLTADLEEAEQCVKNSVTVILGQNEYDALVSFVFNLGCNALRRSSLLRYLNNGHRHLVPDEFGKWVYSKGQVLSGLVRRRDAERTMFMGSA